MFTPEYQPCRTCGETKPMIELRLRQCATCKNAYQAAWRARNKERMRDYRKTNAARDYARHLEWIRNHRERNRAHAAESAARYPQRVRLSRLKHQLAGYGLTLENYRAMLIAQDSRCAICGDHLDELGRLAVDHDHSTGRVRGLLCNRCNPGIAMFKDDPERLRAAIAYLEATRVY